MSATTLERDDVADYLARVRAALADLPPEERDALLADVESSLRDAAAEGTDPVERRLGAPEAFAADLRSAAGFGPAVTSAPDESAIVRLERRLRALREPLRDFAPLWWVARAYVAVAFAATVLGSSWYYRFRLIPMLHSARWTELIFISALAVSLILGPLRPRWMRGFDLVIALAIIPVAIQVAGNHGFPDSSAAVSEPVAAGPAVLTYGDSEIQNVYAYDRRGHLIRDARLFDDLGRPLNVGGADPQRRVVRVRGGRAVRNAFPIRYYDPGTHRVAHPDAAPRKHVPSLVTKPLRRPAHGKARR